MKVRLFLIPFYGLFIITAAHNQRVANKFVRLLNHRETLRALIEFPCESDDISVGVNNSSIPPIASYTEDCQFFKNLPHSRDKDLYKLESIGRSYSKRVGRELILRRCISSGFDEEYKEKYMNRDIDTVLHKIVECESVMTCPKLIRGIEEYLVDCKYENMEDSFISDGFVNQPRGNNHFASFPTV